MNERIFTAIGPCYEDVKDHLFDQYKSPAFNDGSGLSTEALEAGFIEILEAGKDEPRIALKARLFGYVLENARIDVDPVDWFADHFDSADKILYRQVEEWRKEASDGPAKNAADVIGRAKATGAFYGELDLGHISPGWRFLLKEGVQGIIAYVESLKEAAVRDGAEKSGDGASASDKVLFYDSVLSVYDAMLLYMARLETEARRMITVHPEAEDRMEKLAGCLNALRHRAPETFYEALQLSYLFHQLIEFEGEWVRSMGSFELNFGPFYEADLASGRITEEDARELIRFYWMKYYANTRGSGNGKNFYFGGLTDEETNGIGPLTYLALDVFYELNQTDPKLSIKINRKTPEKFKRVIAKCLRDGRTNMVIVNDDETLEAIRKRGVSKEDSYEYLLIGCYEPAIEGKEVACNMCIKFNLVKAVELALFNGTDPMTGERIGIDTGNSEEFTTFEGFYTAYEAQLQHQLELVQQAIRDYEGLWAMINPEPFISGTFIPALQNGRDISQYGAKINNTGSMGAGLANAADSLLAIKKTVFEDKRYTMAELKAMLLANFEGSGRDRLYLLNRVAKWGNNDAEADAMALRVANSYTSRVNGVPNGRGGIFTASIFTLDHSFFLGHTTGATPDGRAAHHYLAKGIGAMTGMDKAGVTAQIESVSKLDFTNIPNGSVLDLYLHPSAVDGEKGIDTLIQLIDTYFSQGGYGVQFNILNAEDLKMAQKHPEDYATLQVRLCGWNVYFVTLNEEQQNHFIETTMQVV